MKPTCIHCGGHALMELKIDGIPHIYCMECYSFFNEQELREWLSALKKPKN
jgi:hypothetical protein